MSFNRFCCGYDYIFNRTSRRPIRSETNKTAAKQSGLLLLCTNMYRACMRDYIPLYT